MTNQQADWIKEREAIRARLNKADRQRFTATHSNYPTWDEVRRLLAKSEEDERELERLRANEARYAAAVNAPQNEASETAVEPGDIIFALQSELALREQRISELNAELEAERNRIRLPHY